MRTEKYNPEDYGDDIKYAFKAIGISDRLKDIDVIIAEVCGENDGVHWYWILEMKDKSYMWVSGWCDYSGWGCQDGGDYEGEFKTPEEAIEAVVINYDNRKIKETLLKQISGEIPFSVYQE
jgi:hypothetical protein